VLAARILDVDDFGAVVALLGLFLVASVPGLALQTAVARQTARAAANDSTSDWEARDVVRPTAIVATVAVAVAALAGPLADVGSVPAGVGLAVSAAAGTCTFAMQGLVQGRSRFGHLGVLLLVTAGGRCGGAIIGLVAGGGVGGVMVGHGAGLCLAAAAGLVLLRRESSLARPRPSPRRSVAPGLWQTIAVGVLGIGGFLVLANADVLLARRILPDHDAGLYAGGALVAKVGLWLPQFLALVATPGLADPGRRRQTLRTALLYTVALTALLVVGAAAVGGPAVGRVLGSDYAELGTRTALFAAVGGGLATVNLLLLAALAGGGRVVPVATWLTLAGVAATAWLVRPELTGLVGVMLGWVYALVVAGLVAERHHLLRQVSAEVGPTGPPSV
jgi:O-antigen/teichoic acid export membrane protein